MNIKCERTGPVFFVFFCGESATCAGYSSRTTLQKMGKSKITNSVRNNNFLHATVEYREYRAAPRLDCGELFHLCLAGLVLMPPYCVYATLCIGMVFVF